MPLNEGPHESDDFVSAQRVDLSDANVARVITLDPNVQEIPVRAGLPARLFMSRSNPRTPEWFGYLAPVMTRKPVIERSRALGAVLLVQPNGRRRVLYAATWGTGHFLLREQFLERDLGLRCALNLLTAGAQPGQWDAARLRSVRAKRVGPDVLITESQTARLAPLESFAFSADVDQLRAVTGVPLDSDRWGKSVTGGVSLHVRRPGEIAGITQFCRDVERGCSHQPTIARTSRGLTM